MIYICLHDSTAITSASVMTTVRSGWRCSGPQADTRSLISPQWPSRIRMSIVRSEPHRGRAEANCLDRIGRGLGWKVGAGSIALAHRLAGRKTVQSSRLTPLDVADSRQTKQRCEARSWHRADTASGVTLAVGPPMLQHRFSCFDMLIGPPSGMPFRAEAQMIGTLPCRQTRFAIRDSWMTTARVLADLDGHHKTSHPLLVRITYFTLLPKPLPFDFRSTEQQKNHIARRHCSFKYLYYPQARPPVATSTGLSRISPSQTLPEPESSCPSIISCNCRLLPPPTLPSDPHRSPCRFDGHERTAQTAHMLPRHPPPPRPLVAPYK